MRIVSDGRSWPPHQLVRRWRQFWFDRRDALTCEVEIRAGEQAYRFRCTGMLELSRSMSLFTKESGTCAWILEEVQAGDVFYDIGANIGLYTVLAGRQVGPHGKVYGFEPHGPNFARLLDNVALNGLQNVVTPCSVALHDQPGFFAFNYVSAEAGSADSQLASRHRSAEIEYRPEIAELKYASSIDALLDGQRSSRRTMSSSTSTATSCLFCAAWLACYAVPIVRGRSRSRSTSVTKTRSLRSWPTTATS